MIEWQPIETAPTDVDVLVWFDHDADPYQDPTGVYQSFPVKGFDWLTVPFFATGFRQSRPDLANGPMGDCSLRTGPEQERNEVRHA